MEDYDQVCNRLLHCVHRLPKDERVRKDPTSQVSTGLKVLTTPPPAERPARERSTFKEQAGLKNRLDSRDRPSSNRSQSLIPPLSVSLLKPTVDVVSILEMHPLPQVNNIGSGRMETAHRGNKETESDIPVVSTDWQAQAKALQQELDLLQSAVDCYHPEEVPGFSNQSGFTEDETRRLVRATVAGLTTAWGETPNVKVYCQSGNIINTTIVRAYDMPQLDKEPEWPAPEHFHNQGPRPQAKGHHRGPRARKGFRQHEHSSYPGSQNYPREDVYYRRDEQPPGRWR